MTLPKSAQALSDQTFGDRETADTSNLSLSEAMTVFHAHAADARRMRNGRELTLFEEDPVRVGRLIDLLIAGNYRDTAGNIAGISSRSLRSWMKQAEEGDARYAAFATVVTIAEALAESAAVRNVRAAGKDPRFWAAEMTYLERRHPEKWGRRNESQDGPKVVVQIGVQASDVRVLVAPVPTSSDRAT